MIKSNYHKDKIKYHGNRVKFTASNNFDLSPSGPHHFLSPYLKGPSRVRKSCNEV